MISSICIKFIANTIGATSLCNSNTGFGRSTVDAIASGSSNPNIIENICILCKTDSITNVYATNLRNITSAANNSSDIANSIYYCYASAKYSQSQFVCSKGPTCLEFGRYSIRHIFFTCGCIHDLDQIWERSVFVRCELIFEQSEILPVLHMIVLREL